MTLPALMLVLAAAALHAIWNLLAKRGGGGLPFVFLIGIVTLTLYAPVISVFCWWKHPELSGMALAWILGSGVIKTGYILVLHRSYRAGDFSLVYPLGRGAGPLFSTAAAIVVFGERPSPLALAGGLVVIAGIFFLAGGLRLFHETRAHVRPALRFGATLGLFIAAFTLWDRHGVAVLKIPPIFIDAGSALTNVTLLFPFAVQRLPEVAEAWRLRRGPAVGVAALSALSYVLVLTALSFTPVSYIAPAREVSIVFGAFLGSKYLKEAEGRRRAWSAAAIAAGIIALAAG